MPETPSGVAAFEELIAGADEKTSQGSFIINIDSEDMSSGGTRRMSPCQAYFAIIKAYCAINVLLLPKAFRNGGYLFSPACLIISCIFECTCAIKLSQCAQLPAMRNLPSLTYPDVVLLALGPGWLKPFKLFIALVQF